MFYNFLVKRAVPDSSNPPSWKVAVESVLKDSTGFAIAALYVVKIKITNASDKIPFTIVLQGRAWRNRYSKQTNIRDSYSRLVNIVFTSGMCLMVTKNIYTRKINLPILESIAHAILRQGRCYYEYLHNKTQPLIPPPALQLRGRKQN